MRTNGIRVLVVEDELIVAMFISDCLEDAGYAVVALTGSLHEAVRLANTLALDAAVLDLNLRGEMSLPVAHALRRRRIPFIVCSAYDTSTMPGFPPNVPAISKPVS